MIFKDLIFTCSNEDLLKHNVIYRFRDEKNKFAYVGLTTQSMKDRVRAHLNQPGNSAFDKWISSTQDVWYVDFLGQYNDIEVLIQKEKDFYYDSKIKYIMMQSERCLGALSTHGRKYWVCNIQTGIEYNNLIRYEVQAMGLNNLDKLIRQELKSENGFIVLDASDLETINSVREQIKNKTYLYGHQITQQKESRSVWAINIKTKEEYTFPSQTSAAEGLGVPMQNLNGVLDQRRLTVGDYTVVRLDEPERILETRQQVLNDAFIYGHNAKIKNKIANQDLIWCIHTTSGEEDQDRCITHLGHRLGIKSIANIHKVLKGERAQCGGYKFLRNPSEEEKQYYRNYFKENKNEN